MKEGLIKNTWVWFWWEKLNLKQRIDGAILKINEGKSVIKKLGHILPRKSLIPIYNVFLIPLIDYGDIIYEQH